MAPFSRASALADRLRPAAPLTLVGLGDGPLALGALVRSAGPGARTGEAQ